MTTSEQPVSQPEPPLAAAAQPARVVRQVSGAEQLLLLVALAVAVLFDRLLLAPPFGGREFEAVTRLAGIFWLCVLVLFYAFYWSKLARNRVLWYVAGCLAALCVWRLFYAGSQQFAALNYVVIPAVLMAHVQYAASELRLKDAWQLAVCWLLGWIARPLTGLSAFFDALGSLSKARKETVNRVAAGVGITALLLGVIVPLLSSADRVFGYYLEAVFGRWNLGSLVGHTLVVVIATAPLYSLLWNVGYGSKERFPAGAPRELDRVIAGIVLGSMTALYLLYCAVQFTYLFAGAGLPADMTYSEYAREGFAQTVAVCAINLLVFGAFVQGRGRTRAMAWLLAGLLALTGVMLLSGALRLKLYIDAYGLTWLRLLSAWFIVYLAVVIALCVARMLREEVPAVALCALILLGWFVLLGYANPQGLIAGYNQVRGFDLPETRLVLPRAEARIGAMEGVCPQPGGRV